MMIEESILLKTRPKRHSTSFVDVGAVGRVSPLTITQSVQSSDSTVLHDSIRLTHTLDASSTECGIST